MGRKIETHSKGGTKLNKEELARNTKIRLATAQSRLGPVFTPLTDEQKAKNKRARNKIDTAKRAAKNAAAKKTAAAKAVTTPPLSGQARCGWVYR